MILLLIILILVFGPGLGYYGYRNNDGSWVHGGGFGIGGIILVVLIFYLLRGRF